MKNITLLLAGLVMLSFISISFKSFESERNIAESAILTESNSVDVYYFHRTRRCGSCRVIEQRTINAVETQYAEELQEGLVTINIVNIELPENSEVATRFKVNGVALIVASQQGEEEIVENCTSMAYRYSRNEDQFSAELKKVIDKNLNR